MLINQATIQFTRYTWRSINKHYFANKASEHFFYTPSKLGQSQAQPPLPIQAKREVIEHWLEKMFFALTTYEISIPVLRDMCLAPSGKTGLIVSLLFDYQLTRQIEQMGWYEDFKTLCERCIINALDSSIYPGIKQAILPAIQLNTADHGETIGQLGGCHHGMGVQQPSDAGRKQITEDLKP